MLCGAMLSYEEDDDQVIPKEKEINKEGGRLVSRVLGDAMESWMETCLVEQSAQRPQHGQIEPPDEEMALCTSRKLSIEVHQQGRSGTLEWGDHDVLESDGGVGLPGSDILGSGRAVSDLQLVEGTEQSGHERRMKHLNDEEASSLSMQHAQNSPVSKQDSHVGRAPSRIPTPPRRSTPGTRHHVATP